MAVAVFTQVELELCNAIFYVGKILETCTEGVIHTHALKVGVKMDAIKKLITSAKSNPIINTPTAPRIAKNVNKRKKDGSPIEIDTEGTDGDQATSKIDELFSLVSVFYKESMELQKETLTSVQEISKKSYASAASAPRLLNKPLNLTRNEKSVAMFIERKPGEEHLSGSTIKASLQQLPSVMNNKVGIKTIAKPNHLIITARSTEEASLVSDDLSKSGCTIKTLGKRNP